MSLFTIHNSQFRKSFSAFTLMELLIYSAVLGIVSVGLVGLFSNIYRYYANVQIKSNLSQNLRFVSQTIQQTIGSAAKIQSVASSTLVLVMADPTKNPTEFGLENGRAYKKEGTGDKIYLTSENVEVTGLNFSYLSVPAAKVIPGQQWAWSGGASGGSSPGGVGWIDFSPSSQEVWFPFGAGEAVGLAYVPAFDSYLSLSCISTGSCSEVDYKVYADSNWDLHGWAWSDKIGWLSFNSAESGSGVPYKVSISSDTGDLSGWAWSENIGWVSFNCNNSGIGNTCAASDYKVQINRVQGTPTNTVNVSISVRSKSVVSTFELTDSYEFSAPLSQVTGVTVVSVGPAAATSTAELAISGTGLQSGARTKLSRAGYTDVYPTTDCLGFVDAGASQTLQNCSYDVTGKIKGFWDVVVTNPNGQIGILPKGFEIQ